MRIYGIRVDDPGTRNSCLTDGIWNWNYSLFSFCAAWKFVSCGRCVGLEKEEHLGVDPTH